MKLGMVWLVFFSALMIGLAIGSVGDAIKCDDEVYGRDLPFVIAIVFLTPMWIAYVAGRSDQAAPAAPEASSPEGSP